MNIQNWKESIKLPQLIVIILIVVVVSTSTNVVFGWYKEGKFDLLVTRISRGFNNVFHRSVPDRTIPIISDISVSKITTDSAKISWRTYEPTKTKFSLGTDVNYNLWQESFERLTTDHWIYAQMPELKPATEYHFKIMAIDEAGNQTVSEDHAFATLELKIATPLQPVPMPPQKLMPFSPPPESCQDECDQSGLKRCTAGIMMIDTDVSQFNGYDVCGNFDADSCLEWDVLPRICPQGTSCKNGNCVE